MGRFLRRVCFLSALFSLRKSIDSGGKSCYNKKDVINKEAFSLSLKSLFSAKDMTIGSPWKRILEFSIPMLLGNIAQQLYNTADSVIVGMYVGDNALAAVGSAAPILNLLLALFVGISTGAGIVVSQRFGARDREGLSKGIGNCISLTWQS